MGGALGNTKELSTFGVCKKLNISRPTLQDWITRGFVCPTIKARGKGTKSVFSNHDVRLIEVFIGMIKHGFSRELAGDCINKMKASGQYSGFNVLFGDDHEIQIKVIK
mgnify:CR=1 FL=1